MVAWLERWQVPLYLGALVVGAAAGLLAPGASHGFELAISPVLIVLLYATFLAVPFPEIARSLKDARFLGGVLVLNFVFVPVVVFGLSRFVAHEQALLVGVLLVLLTPCIDYVIVFGARRRGVEQAARGVSFVDAVAAPAAPGLPAAVRGPGAGGSRRRSALRRGVPPADRAAARTRRRDATPVAPVRVRPSRRARHERGDGAPDDAHARRCRRVPDRSGASAALLAAGLAGLAFANSIALHLAAWAVIGLGMGAGLYDAAFAALGRRYGLAARGAITTLTLWGGFASTVCWPLSAFLVETVGWRATCLAYALIHVCVVVPLYVVFLVVMPLVGLGAARLFRQDVPSTRAMIFSGATRNSLVVLPLALALPDSLALVAVVIVTQTLVELLGMVVYVRLIPRLVPGSSDRAKPRRVSGHGSESA